MIRLFIFVVIICFAETCTLSDVYDSEIIKAGVRETVGIIFEVKFDDVIIAANKTTPYLVKPANYFKCQIRSKFIEEGTNLESVQDLELILKSFSYLEYQDFRELKLDYDRNRNG